MAVSPRPDNPPSRTCNDCKNTLPASEFYLRPNGTLTAVCKSCTAKVSHAWWIKNREDALKRYSANMEQRLETARRYVLENQDQLPGLQRPNDPPLGTLFGKRTVIGYVPIFDHYNEVFVVLRCECGQVAPFRLKRILAGKSQACTGCYDPYLKHGYCRQDIRPGKHTTPEYDTWSKMLARCLNPKRKDWPRYGGRGITVCTSWKDFPTFLKDMGIRPSPKHSTDRIKNDLGYWCGSPTCPECGPLGRAPNCRWATPQDQANNTRNNRMLELNGRTQTAAEWSRETNIPVGSIYGRLRDGWSIERTLLTPIRAHKTYAERRK